MIWLQSLLRRLSAPGSAPAAVAAEAASKDPPSDLRQTPEPPGAAAGRGGAIPGLRRGSPQAPADGARARRPRAGDVQDRAHEQIVTAALAAISDPAAQKNYFPRRPNLLPELMHAINDESMSVRQLVAIVARDPALVGSLLKVANSSFYRISPQPIESIERAIVVLGNDGPRSVTAAALMQPIFQVSRAGAAPRFPELVWEHAVRSAHAAIPHAALVERVNAFAAELLSLISGLAEIALFRAVIEHCPPSSQQDEVDPLVIASISTRTRRLSPGTSAPIGGCRRRCWQLWRSRWPRRSRRRRSAAPCGSAATPVHWRCSIPTPSSATRVSEPRYRHPDSRHRTSK